MNPEDIKILLEQLMKTGEFLATESFRIAMKQVFTYAIIDLSVGASIFLFGLFMWILGVKKNWDEGFYIPVGLGCFVVGGISMLCSIRFFMNPEWYAINMLIDMVR